MIGRFHGYNAWFSAFSLCICALLSAQCAHAGCLKKPLPVSGLSNIFTFMIAPQSALSGYLSLGFSQINCPGDLTDVRAYVDRLCSGAPDGQLPAINTDVAIGVPRPRACADARAGLAEVTGSTR
jgi:hypothetical protein